MDLRFEESKPRLRASVLLMGLAAALLAVGCAGQSPAPPTARPPVATAAPAPAKSAPAPAKSAPAPAKSAPAAATSAPAAEDVDLETKGFVDSPDGRLRVAGRAGLLLSLRQAASPPAPPPGWRLILPVFDVTARDRQRRPVAELREALSLRFDVAADRPATVLVHGSGGWQIVPSEFESDGRLAARVDHLTPYSVGTPTRGAAAAGLTPAAAPTGGATRVAATPAAAATRVATITPGANATVAVATAAPAAAESALAEAVKALKGKSVRVTSAVGYSGSAYVAIPPALEGALGSALGAGGTGYYGLYNAVNEAITVQAGGANAAGALTLLVEPKTSMPASAADAKSQLAALFPGVTVSLTQVQATTAAYLFYGVSGNTAYSVGYLSYEGVALAYALAGSGSYQALVPKG